MNCENCKHGKVTHGRNVIQQNGMTIIQNGGTNVTCTITDKMNLNICIGKIDTCSGYEPREEVNDH